MVSIHTYYFWSDPQAILAEIFRVLKPGGTLLFTFSNGKIGEERDYYDQTFIEEQMLPRMRSVEFTEVSTMPGPISRQFKNLAVIGAKPSA